MVYCLTVTLSPKNLSLAAAGARIRRPSLDYSDALPYHQTQLAMQTGGAVSKRHGRRRPGTSAAVTRAGRSRGLTWGEAEEARPKGRSRNARLSTGYGASTASTQQALRPRR
jgi:hypothetical protein